jgi:hypothetical protein
MDVKKSVIEEAMLDAKKIQEALKANTREILRSVAREEIDELVKESLLKEDDFEEEDIDTNDDAEPDVDATSEPDPETSIDVKDGDGDTEVDVTDDGLGDSTEVATEIGQEDGMDADAFDGEDLDLTAASDDDVIAIYKKLSGDDEIEIVGDDIHLNVTEPGEYVIKGAASAAEDSEINLDDYEEVGDEPGEDDVDYEIELGDDDVEDETGAEDGEAIDDTPEETETKVDEPSAEDDTEEKPEDEIEEQIATNRVAQNRAGGDLTKIKGPGARQGASLSESQKAKKIVSESAIKYNKLLTESNKLKTENEEFRKALSKFRGMLTETVVFNANLSYVTKLFMEQTTTKEEKKNIIKRFDEEVSNLKESKKLYKTIVNELSARKPISESIENKLIKEGASSSSKQLNEATAYVDPSTQRIMDLIRRVENK